MVQELFHETLHVECERLSSSPTALASVRLGCIGSMEDLTQDQGASCEHRTLLYDSLPLTGHSFRFLSASLALGWDVCVWLLKMSTCLRFCVRTQLSGTLFCGGSVG